MARVKVCGVCWKPVNECICDDDAEPGMTWQDESDDGT